LRSALKDGVAAIRKRFAGMRATIDHVEQFRPGRPTPTHRLETPEVVAA
jgi:hypothetical protein